MSKTDSKGRCTNRYRQHTRNAKNGTCSPIYNAWRKHGAPTQTIMSAHATRAECALAEIDAIQAFDSLNPVNGYNLMAGGEGLNAPAGSAVHELMRTKVWDNPEWRRKLSEAFKGRPVSPETRAGHATYIQTDEAKAIIAEISRRPETRAAIAIGMRKRLEDPDYRKWLSEHQVGKPKNISAEGRARILAGRAAYIASDEGKRKARLGLELMRAVPANMTKRKQAHAAYLASDANKAHCQANAQRNRKRVRELATGREFESQREVAEAFNVSRPTVNYWVRTGKFVQLSY